jgi:hypothetical protein
MNAYGTVVASSQSTTGRLAVWRWTGTAWSKEADLVATGWSGAGGTEGLTDACTFNADGTLLSAGTPDDTDTNWGSVWTWTYTGGTWVADASRLRGSVTAIEDRFGASLEMSQDGVYLLVGAPEFESGNGCVRFYQRSGSLWSALNAFCGTAAFTGTYALVGASPHVGFSVTITQTGTFAATGSPNEDTNKGTTRMFCRSGSTWSLCQYIPNGDASLAGWSLSLTNTFLAISKHGFNSFTGQAVMFTFNGGSGLYEFTQTIVTPAPSTTGQAFGKQVKVMNNALVITGNPQTKAQVVWFYTT